MSDSGDLIRPVSGVLDDLREVLHVRDMRENGGLQADQLELRRTWKKLNEALLELADVIQKPQPGQGLASVWLRAICEKAAKVEEAAKRYPNGWSDVLFHDDMSVSWLVIDHWQNGYHILKWSRDQQPGLESLLAPESSLPDRLRRLGEQWTTECDNAADERQRNEVDNTYRRQVGDTFLDAVDALYITYQTLEIADFEVQVLRYLDLPSGLVPAFLPEVSGEGLLAFIERLEEPRDDEAEAERQQSEQYPLPGNYARDKWIYEKFNKHDCHSLSLKLKKKVAREKWVIITSRNGFKKAADRYAKFHGFSKRRFSDDDTAS